MDKRLLLAVALSMGVLFVWWQVFPPPTQMASRPAVTEVQPSTAAPAPTAQQPATTAETTAEPQPAKRGPEELVTLESEDVRFVLSSWGGVLREARLKDRRFQPRGDEKVRDIDNVVRTTSVDQAPFRITFPNSEISVPDQAAWTVSRPGPNAVTFRTETDKAVIERRYRLEPGRFRLGLDVVVRNKGETARKQNLALHLYGRQNAETKGGSFLDYAAANTADMVCYVGEKVRRHSVESLQKEAQTFTGTIPWAAADEKFLTLAVVPQADPEAGQRTCSQRSTDGQIGEVTLGLPERSIPAGGETTYGFTVYAGPKYVKQLDAVTINGKDAQLGELVNVTFAVLSRPLLFLLKGFQGFVSNWGLAIILLTLFVKLVTFYPTYKTMMSAKKMQRLAPQLAVIRKKFENDRQRQGTETMSLYRQHGVSPFGGCLPSLIQMPIWIALFSMLNYAVELHRASFLYLADLSAKDPYYVTPLLMGIVMVIQMRMSPAGVDPQQQKMMAIMMPIMFTGFSLFLPAGLAIYTLTSYLLGIVQQLFVNWRDRRVGGTPAKA